jgi:hypothetical protein
MFFGRPACPVTEEVRVWLEERWAWLSERERSGGLRSGPMLTPTQQDLPVGDARGEHLWTRVWEVLVRHVGLDAASLRLVAYPAGPRPGAIGEEGRWEENCAAGFYTQETSPPTIALRETCFEHPPTFIATLSHELAHAVLLGGQHLTGDEEDHEPLTDLATVHLGLGLFTANGALHEQAWISGRYEGWSVARFGYLNFTTFGYALALRAQRPGEPWGHWEAHLRPDVRQPFRAAQRYLARRR